MLRILGVNIPENKQVGIALTRIYGVGYHLSGKILRQAKIDPLKKASDLTGEEEKKIANLIEKDHKVEGDLRREIKQNIRRLKEINSWRGERHKRRLPARGQTTRVNSRTVRGNVRRTMGSGRKAPPSPK